MRFHITTLGCPKNTVDSEMMGAVLRTAGHVVAKKPGRADVLIVNTCAFIEEARQESYDALSALAAKKRPGQRLVVAGCLAQRYRSAIREHVPEVDGIIGAQSWPEIVALLRSLERGESQPLIVRDGGRDLIASVRRHPEAGPSAYLKIGDGCDASCAFCAIPAIKGPQRSKPLAEVVREAQELAQQGVREVVLVAQDTTAWGRDLAGGGTVRTHRIEGLIDAIAAAVPQLDWLRVLYAYPQHVTESLVEAMANLPQVCHYLDLPLQHGHPEVLRRMHRPHDVATVWASISALRTAMPDIALRSSFIVGFPGETEAEFEGLLRFMNEISFDKVGIFAYSLEESTPAADLPDRVPAEVIAERYDRAMRAQQGISLRRNRQQIGRELPILVEGSGDGLSVGRSYRDAPEIDGLVLMPGELPVGAFVDARIVDAQAYDLVAEPIIDG